jgi:ABC-type antimicrobial peptide transport system permease subunit
MFKMAILISKIKAAVIVVCVLLFIMNISHSSLMKRTNDMRILSSSGFSGLSIFFSMLFEIVIVSIVAGIIGGFIAVTCSGMTVNLQLATVILKIEPSAILKGVILAIILGFLGTILPILKLSFSHHRRLKD